MKPRSTLRRTAVVLALLAIAAVLAAVNPALAGYQLREKDLNLDIARRVEARLRSLGIPVYMTRASDRTVSLASRVALANGHQVDAFVSIHNNASPSRNVHGTEVYRSIHGGASAELGADLAAELGRNPGLPTSTHARRGDHGDYYYVIRNARVPAVIVEGAYVSNPSDARLLASASFRQRLADGIVAGILDYQRSLVARPLPATTTPTRIAAPVLAPSGAAGAAVNSRTVSLSWTANPTALAYHVYRDGALIGTVSSSLASTTPPSFTDVWAAPGQTYHYEIAQEVSVTSGLAVESSPARLTVHTPPIVVALDPGHGGSDPGAIGSY